MIFKANKLFIYINKKCSRRKVGFEDTVKESFSQYDVTNKEAKSFYHTFVMGLLVNIWEEYEIKSNREAGIGRYDLSIMKRDRSKGAIFEFKRVR